MNILTTGMPDLWNNIISECDQPNISFERNFEQILGMVKDGEVDKICIIMDVWNIGGRSFNGMRGQGAAEKIHEINPDIPILIWDGREYDPEIPGIPPCFQISGKVHELKNPNELYLSFDHYSNEDVVEITTKFFNDNLSSQDVKEKECISFPFQAISW